MSGQLKTNTLRIITLVLLFLTAVPFYGSAQSNDTARISRQLKEVTVTAEKQAEDIQDIPASISYINDIGAVNQRIWNVGNLKGIFPNLYLSQPGDGRNVIGIRGIATTSYNPAVAVYVDGVVQFGLDTYFNGLLDIKRIEVLRGPQGTLYGRNAMGGVINIITKEPTNKLSGFAGVDVGNHGLTRYRLGINIPLISGKLFAGISALYEKDNGFYTNRFDNSHFDKKHTLLGNYYLKYLPGSNWVITANYKNSIARNHGAFALAPSIKDALNNPFTVNQDATTQMVDNVSNASFSIQHHGRRLHFSSQTSYQYNYRIYKEPIDGDFSPLDIVSIVNNYGKDWNNVGVWTQEFRLSSPKNTLPKSSRIHSWMLGLFGFTQNNPTKQGTHYGKDAGVYGAPPNMTMLSTNTGKDKGIALYGQTNISLAKKLDLTLGLRYDWESKKMTGKSESLMPGQDPQTIQPDSTGKGTYHAFSPKTVLSYHLKPNHLLFLSYSRGFRAGGISKATGNPAEPPLRTFDPELSDNFELGMKNEFLSNRLRWNASVFYTRVKDIQVPQLILPEAVTITRNRGKLRSMGVESELTALLGKHFSARWNAGITDAEFTQLSMAEGNENKDLSGNKQLFTPDFTSNLMVQYHKSLGHAKTWQLMARVEWRWLGTTYFNLLNTLKQNPYHLLNAKIGIKRKHIGLSIWSKNMLDTHYVDYAYNFGAAHLGNPATYGASLKVNF